MSLRATGLRRPHWLRRLLVSMIVVVIPLAIAYAAWVDLGYFPWALITWPFAARGGPCHGAGVEIFAEPGRRSENFSERAKDTMSVASVRRHDTVHPERIACCEVSPHSLVPLPS